MEQIKKIILSKKRITIYLMIIRMKMMTAVIFLTIKRMEKIITTIIKMKKFWDVTVKNLSVSNFIVNAFKKEKYVLIYVNAMIVIIMMQVNIKTKQ